MNRGGELVNKINKIISRKFNSLLKEKNIDEFNGPQGVIMYHLWLEEKLTITEIAKRTSLAKTTLTSMLERMSNLDLINKISDDKDKRKTYIILTNKAKNLEKDFNEINEKMNNLFYKGFSNEEINQFESYLYKILENVSD